jgi:hypothetical protein
MNAVMLAAARAFRVTGGANRFSRWWIIAGCCIGYLLVLAAWSAPSRTADDRSSPPEQAIKAAFLYRFLGYVEWPAGVFSSNSAPIVIGVLGADDIADQLRSVVASREVGERRVEVRQADERDALDGVQVLFVGQGERAMLSRLVPAAQQRSVLLVTDFDGALDHGSVINLVIVENRMRFEVSLEAAERSALKLSSRMLAVALWVRPTP